MVHIFASAEGASSRLTNTPSEQTHPVSAGLAVADRNQPGCEGSGAHGTRPSATASIHPRTADPRQRWAALDSRLERLVDATHPLPRDLTGD